MEGYDDVQTGRILFQQAQLYQDLEEFDKALSTVSECEIIYEKVGFLDGIPGCFQVKGSIFLMMENVENALVVLKDAEQLMTPESSSYNNTVTALALAYEQLKRWEKALHYRNIHVKLAKKHGGVDYAVSLNNLGFVYYQTKGKVY